MDMIGHHHPRQKTILHPVMMPKVALDQLSDPGVAQVAGTQAAVEGGLKFLSLLHVVFDFQQGLPFASAFCGQGVVQTIGDELLRALRIEVRQVFGSVPAFEASLLFFGAQRFAPRALGFDEPFELGLHGAAAWRERSARATPNRRSGDGLVPDPRRHSALPPPSKTPKRATFRGRGRPRSYTSATGPSATY